MTGLCISMEIVEGRGDILSERRELQDSVSTLRCERGFQECHCIEYCDELELYNSTGRLFQGGRRSIRVLLSLDLIHRLGQATSKRTTILNTTPKQCPKIYHLPL